VVGSYDGHRAAARGQGRRAERVQGEGAYRCSRRAGVSLEPSPHPCRRNRYYISPLLSVQILTVKIGKKTLCIRAFIYLLTYKGICEVDSCKLHQGGVATPYYGHAKNNLKAILFLLDYGLVFYTLLSCVMLAYSNPFWHQWDHSPRLSCWCLKFYRNR